LTIAGSGAVTPLTSLTNINYSITPVDSHHSILSVTASGSTPLTAGGTPIGFVSVAALVPSNAPYLNKALLNLQNVQINGLAAMGTSGVEEAVYLGNVTGDGVPGALDASLVDQVGSGAGTGFSAFKDLDPAIIGAASGGGVVSALDASLINEAGAGASIPQIPSVPTGFTLTMGGPDPYLYLGNVQASSGQTVTETLYLDVTDPDGAQLTALDEAIGFDASMLQISNVRNAAGLAKFGSYAEASTVDNGTGEMLVGQAFMGSGLPPLVPYGTDVPVLQFDVTINNDAPLGAVAGITMLQDGTVNGETKFTAVSDNEGALTWTAGMAPSNEGNPAIDGSVTVVSADASANSEAAIATAPAVKAQPARVASLVHVRSSAAVRPTPAVSQQPVAALAADSSTISIDPSAHLAASIQVEEAVVSSAMPQQTLSLTAGASPTMTSGYVTTVVVPAAAPESLRTQNPARSEESIASLSVSVLGTNKVFSVASSGTSNGRTSTSAMDEMYRQFGASWGATAASGCNLGGGYDDTAESLEAWLLEDIVADIERWRNLDD
jgi:hypothetical protein